MFGNKNLKKLVIILTSGFILMNVTSCKNGDVVEERVVSNENNKKTNDQDTKLVEESVNSYTSKDITSDQNINDLYDVVEQDETINEETIQENQTATQESINTNDENILTYCYEVEEEIKTYLESEEVSETKEMIADRFIILVDFLFYDTKINGVTFDELSDDTKEKIKEITSNLLAKICTKYPDFSNTVEEKYKELKPKVSFKFDQMTDYLGEKYEASLKKIEEVIGTENYNNFKEGKDDMKESFQETYESTKTYVKDWYEEFRNRHE